MRSLSALVITIVTLSTQAHAGTPTTQELLDRADDLYRGESSRGEMTMSITTEHWKRTLSLEFWSQGSDKSLMKIQSPKKEKGTATLMVGRDVWNFLPKVKRVIKVPSSMMGASWMGSHLTNDDLVKKNRMANDYDASITFSGERNGLAIYEVTCITKEDATVVWGKVVLEIGQQDQIPRTIQYFDEDMVLSRTMTFSDIQTIGAYTLPMTFKMTEVDRPNESTEMTYNSLAFDVKHPDKLFSLRSLQR